MLTPLLLLWPVSLALTWLVAQGLANKPFDRALEYNVHALAQFVTLQGGVVQFNAQQSVNTILRSDEADTLWWQVRASDGALLLGEADLPAPPLSVDGPVPTGEVWLRDAELRGVDIRVAWMWIALPTQPTAALVQVAETRSKRSILAGEIIKGVMLPQFAILPLAALLVWLALARGIRPLHRLEERIRARKSDDLSPLEHQAVPMEVAPLVDSVNDLLQRLQESVALQKRFLADAAHQLKTPLAGLRMQADLAQRQNASAEDLKHSLQQIHRSTVRATHTVNQLLALARAEGSEAAIQRQPLDLARLVMQVMEESVPHALARAMDLGYDGVPAGTKGVWVTGNPTLLQELVRNLLDNAINYAPSGANSSAIVTARVLPDVVAGMVLLQVEDSGPGVPEMERELVFQPFYRVLGTDVDGSGLGLSIVREIARQHGAQVWLEDTSPGDALPGARFCVRFVAQF